MQNKPYSDNEFDFIKKNDIAPHKLTVSEKFGNFLSNGISAFRKLDYLKASLAISALLVSGAIYHNGSDIAKNYYANEKAQIVAQQQTQEKQAAANKELRDSFINPVKNISQQDISKMVSYILTQKAHNDQLFQKAMFTIEYLRDAKIINAKKDSFYERKGAFDRWMDAEAQEVLKTYTAVSSGATANISNEALKKVTDWYSLYQTQTVKVDFQMNQQYEKLASKIDNQAKFDEAYAGFQNAVATKKPKM